MLQVRDNGRELVEQEVARCMEQVERAEEEVPQFILTKTEKISIYVCSQMFAQSTKQTYN